MMDFDWIKTAVNKILKIWLLVPFLLIAMFLISDWFYYFWIGDKIIVTKSLSLLMALFALLMTFNMVFVNFINGVSKIRVQLVTAIITMIINIPLSIFFANHVNLGINGVILATCFCLSYSCILRPIQYYKIINNKAKGIWNK